MERNSSIQSAPNYSDNSNLINKKFSVQNPRSNNHFSKKIFISLITFFILFIGGVAAFFLLQINQDIRQQASDGAYINPVVANANDPGNAEFGWNYNTNKPATAEDWTKIYDENGKEIQIAGTYIHCQEGKCERYVVNLPATHNALNQYASSHQQVGAECVKTLEGVCVAWKDRPKPTATPVPTIKPQPTAAASPTASPTAAPISRCSGLSSTACGFGRACVYTPYGYYCQDISSITTAEGTKQCDGDIVMEFKSNSWSKKYTCMYGCANGQCNTAPVATATPKLTATPIPIDYSNYPDWNETCHQSCQPGLKCVNNKCIADCPTSPSGDCNNFGLLCEDTTDRLINNWEGNMYICNGGSWTQKGELRINFDSSCSEEDKSVYRESFAHAPENLLPKEHIDVSCGDPPPITTTIDGVDYEGVACGQYSTDNYNSDHLYLYCNDPQCHIPEAGYDCDYTTTHELVHNQANETQWLGSAEVTSFNEAIGCKSAGKGKFEFSENPVTTYGRANCAEAYAELVTVYSENPCYIKNSGEYQNQHNWLMTSNDSPYQGQDNCQEGGKG